MNQLPTNYLSGMAYVNSLDSDLLINYALVKFRNCTCHCFKQSNTDFNRFVEGY
jgi:hypothetical protein